jgi:hypothetical protein
LPKTSIRKQKGGNSPNPVTLIGNEKAFELLVDKSTAIHRNDDDLRPEISSEASHAEAVEHQRPPSKLCPSRSYDYVQLSFVHLKTLAPLDLAVTFEPINTLFYSRKSQKYILYLLYTYNTYFEALSPITTLTLQSARALQHLNVCAVITYI